MRVEEEGWSFMTITLPAFCKDFERSLEVGCVNPDLFSAFRKRGGLPLFLGGFLDRIFDRSTGVLLHKPDTDSIFAVRQLTLMFGKMFLPCTDARVETAVKGYVKCEQEVLENDKILHDSDALRAFGRVSSLLFRDVLSQIDGDIYEGTVLPKHGPGATADRLRGNAKYDQREWPRRLEDIFPFGDYAIPNWRHGHLLDLVELLEPGQERPVRVITVPKTLKTPRIIAIEPTAMQYMQQALMEKFVQYLETDSTVSGMIGFTDQVPNQDLAREGSLNRELATLDLSEASDRVSNLHVLEMLRNFPWLSQAVQATRSEKADVPGHGIISLSKFASMGSALCFPMEAMVFMTVIFLGIEHTLSRQLTRKDVESLSSQVRVYGDDIIVPVDFVPSVYAYLELFGFKVNSSKSFSVGKFRESCGKEYFDGVDVSITRVRRVFPSTRADVEETVSLVSLRNQLYLAGLWRSAFWVDNILEQLLVHFPYVEPTSPVLGRISYLGLEQSSKIHPHTHAPLVRGYVVRSLPPISTISGEGALLKWFLKRGSEPFADPNHLERQGRPEAVGIKLRWASPF